MTTRNPLPRPARDDAGRQASARHQGLYRPHEDQRIDQALEQISLEDRGEAAEDYLRDRRSRGAAPAGESRGPGSHGKRNEGR